MKCKSKLYFYVLMPLLCFALVLPMYTIPSYASTTDSGYVPPIQEQWAQNVYNNFQTVLQDSLKVAVPKSEADQIWNDYVDHAYSIWNLEFDDLSQHYGHFRDYVGAQFEMEENSNGTYNYNMSEDAYTFIQDSYNTYLQENPLTYSEAYIHTYNMVNVQWFPTYQLYQTWLSWAAKQDGFILTRAYIANGSTQGIRACVIPKTNDINFVGTVTGGVFTNVAMYIGWSTTNTPWTIATGAKWVEILNNGTIRDFNGAGQVASTLGNTTNINDSTTNRWTVWTNLPKDEKVYVFNSLNALKAYNSISPQPYYTMSGYTGIISPSGDYVPDTNGAYESIVNNVQNGWTAQEVLALVDRIMSSGTGSGSGSSDNDDGWLDLGIFGDIGKAIAKILGGIIEAIGTVFTEIIGIITNVSETLLQGVIFDFLSALLGWLPEEIIAVITALFSIAVLFALIKLIREAF